MARPIRLRVPSCLTMQIVSLLAVLALWHATHASASQEIRTEERHDVSVLEPGRTIRQEIRPGETHYYKLQLEAGQYVQFLLKYYRGVNLRVIWPDGSEASRVGGDFWDDSRLVGLERPIITQFSGTYRAEVWNPDESELQSYELWVSQPRVATERDHQRLLAMKALTEMGLLHSERKAASYLRAIERGEEAALLWHELAEPGYEIRALYITGEAHWELGDYLDAIDHFKKGLAVCIASGDRVQQFEVLVSMGQSYQNLSEYQKALDLYRQALSLLEGDRHFADRRPWVLDNIGAAYHSLGDNEQALEYHQKAALLVQVYLPGGGGERDIAHAFTRIGEVLASMGEKQKALDYLESALPNWRVAHDPWGEARVFHRMGDVYASLGDSERALDHYGQALALWHETGDAEAEAATLNGIGAVHVALGDNDKALEHFNRALEIKRKIGQPEGEAQSLALIGSSHYAMGDWPGALDYDNRALAIWKDIGNPAGEARTLNDMGDAYRALGDLHTALDCYDKALPKLRAVKDLEAQARTLHGLARAERDRDNLEEALAAITQAVDLVEGIRTSLASDDLRASYLGKVRDYYETYIDLLMRLDRLNKTGADSAEALHVSERARARVLLELLKSAGADIRQGVDPVLLDQQRSLSQKLKGKARYREGLLARKHTEEEAAALDTEIREIESDYEHVQAQIRATSPRYAALTQPQPLTVRQIQELIDTNTLVLEYALGDKNSYLWVVGDRSLRAHQLPGRAEIDRAARRVYELQTERNRRVESETEMRMRERVARADRDYIGAAAVLSRMVLGPAASELAHKRLLIVADGALQFVSFAALPAPSGSTPTVEKPSHQRPGSSRRSAATVPLILDHEIISLPSASSLAVLRRELKGREAAPKTLALLADPVFSVSDARVHGPSGQRELGSSDSAQLSDTARSPSRDLQRALRDAGEAYSADRLPRLLATHWEAEHIRALLPESERMIALNFAANRETATSAELSNYRIVHFASHALIDSVHPELSGIVLSLVDEQGRPRDGFLRAHEVFNLNLPADLVVLNACRTGLGKEVRGEGMIGLTRAFMYAGAARVLMSLWSVEDRSASELMKRMYTRMLGPEHLSPAAALRAAQIEMWRQPNWRSPYFWAGYSLQGEWK